jgi:hypothetical protein
MAESHSQGKSTVWLDQDNTVEGAASQQAWTSSPEYLLLWNSVDDGSNY